MRLDSAPTAESRATGRADRTDALRGRLQDAPRRHSRSPKATRVAASATGRLLHRQDRQPALLDGRSVLLQMYVHRHRGGLSAVREVETQRAVSGKGRRDLPANPRSPADGGNGHAGRDVQSIRHGPRRSDGSCDVPVTNRGSAKPDHPRQITLAAGRCPCYSYPLPDANAPSTASPALASGAGG